MAPDSEMANLIVANMFVTIKIGDDRMSVMAAHEPISRRERPAKPALSREVIVDAAMRVLERDGVGKLTVRRVAAELDTGPASLYVYVKNVTLLHALLADRALAELDLAWDEDEPWRDRMHRLLGDYVNLFAQRGELARSVVFVWPEGPHYLDLIDLLLRLLQAGGATERATSLGVDLLLQYASTTAAECATRAADSGQNVADLAAVLASADPERQPALASFNTAAFVHGTPEERRRWAIDTLIDGITGSRA